MAKMSIIFDGFDKLAEQIDELNRGKLKQAVDEALVETSKYIQLQVTKATEPYKSASPQHKYATGAMYSSIIKDDTVTWSGTVAEVKVGYDITKKGGYHSIFVMYGSPKHVPYKPKQDKNIYNAIKGTATNKKIKQLQENIMKKYLEL